MRLLLSNDDGVNAPGLEAMAKELEKIAEIRVVAPDRDHSGASNSLTLTRPLHPVRLPNGFVALDGTPTDCVHLGLNLLYPDEIERVISGINTHANLGDDVLYSGTVAAATEGRFLQLPAIAVSLVNYGQHHYDTAARVVREILQKKLPLNVSPRTILNINVPDLPYSELRGIRVTRLGHRAKGGCPQKILDPRGKVRYWIAAAGEGEDAGPGTDFYAIRHNYVSVTPLQVDMTRYEAFAELGRWLETE